MAVKYISELTSVSVINDTDVLVIDDGDHNYKIAWAALKLLLGTVSAFAADPDQESYPGRLKITLANGTVLRAYCPDPAKQDKLTFDDAPTEGSNNPVKSNGIKLALDDKLDTEDYKNFTGATLSAAGTAGIVPAPASVNLYLDSSGAWQAPDSEPTAGSQKLITSAAVKAAIQAITLTIDTAMSDSSTNPVQNKVITAKMKSTAQADQAYHMGFYIDADGDLCQA